MTVIFSNWFLGNEWYFMIKIYSKAIFGVKNGPDLKLDSNPYFTPNASLNLLILKLYSSSSFSFSFEPIVSTSARISVSL